MLSGNLNTFINALLTSCNTVDLHCILLRVQQSIMHSRPCCSVLLSWPWSMACSAWTHVWYANARRYQSPLLSGVRLWALTHNTPDTALGEPSRSWNNVFLLQTSRARQACRTSYQCRRARPLYVGPGRRRTVELPSRRSAWNAAHWAHTAGTWSTPPSVSPRPRIQWPDCSRTPTTSSEYWPRTRSASARRHRRRDPLNTVSVSQCNL